MVIHHGDSREVIRSLADNSIDAVVTDPPYALVSIVKRFGGENAAPAKSEGASGVYKRASAGFMGKTWDTGETAFDPAFWADVLRVLKPGGHLIAASGTRTYHRLACAVEDAGFEIRDMVSWLYGSGFPKSHDVSKGIAKRRTEDAEPVRAVCRFLRAAMDARGLSSRDLTRHFGGCHSRLIDHWAARDTDSQPSLPTPDQWLTLTRVLDLQSRDDFALVDREVVRLNARKGLRGERWTGAEIVGVVDGDPAGFGEKRFQGDRTVRALDEEAAAWEGWGTALKPACEPWVLARKPLDGTVAANVLKHGTGALNIDGCRVAFAGVADEAETKGKNRHGAFGSGPMTNAVYGKFDKDRDDWNPPGRWPANVVHDGSDEVVAGFPAEPEAGSAARFFYTAKADAEDRLGSKHPTVKPTDLMRWLVRLITPPGGVVLDPFAGTGSTGVACIAEGFDFILIEREAEYVADIERRIAWARGEGRATVLEMARLDSPEKQAKAAGEDLPLFGGVA